MQDDNLQHMEYLLTRDIFEIWLLNESSLVIEWHDFLAFSDNLKKAIFANYLKTHGLPADSLIKE